MDFFRSESSSRTASVVKVKVRVKQKSFKKTSCMPRAKGFSRLFHGCSKGGSRVFHGYFKGGLRVFFLRFRGCCNMFKGCLMNVLRVCPVSRLFLWIFSGYSRVF